MKCTPSTTLNDKEVFRNSFSVSNCYFVLANIPDKMTRVEVRMKKGRGWSHKIENMNYPSRFWDYWKYPERAPKTSNLIQMIKKTSLDSTKMKQNDGTRAKKTVKVVTSLWAWWKFGRTNLWDSATNIVFPLGLKFPSGYFVQRYVALRIQGSIFHVVILI